MSESPEENRFVCIIPARNEAESLPKTLNSLREAFPEIHLVVVDDASTDGTGEKAASLGVEVVEAFGRNGKGGAILAGFSHVRRRFSPDDLLLVCDADLDATAANLVPLVEAVEGRTEVAIAAFPSSVAKRGGFGLVKNFARREIARRTGFSPLEPLSGQRAMRLSTLDSLPGIAPGFGAEVGMTLDLIEAGIVPEEIPVELSHRATGKSLSGFLHRAGQGRDILRALRGERLQWPQ